MVFVTELDRFFAVGSAVLTHTKGDSLSASGRSTASESEIKSTPTETMMSFISGSMGNAEGPLVEVDTKEGKETKLIAMKDGKEQQQGSNGSMDALIYENTRKDMKGRSIFSTTTAKLIFEELVLSGIEPSDMPHIFDASRYSDKDRESLLQGKGVERLRSNRVSKRLFSKYRWNRMDSGWSSFFGGL
jgi:hypothetical protein